MARYLVTGGAGFIGSHIAERLLRDGHEVRIFDDFSTGRQENVDALRGAGATRLEVHEADLRDPKAVRRAVAQVDGIFHEAALGSVPRSIDDPWTSLQVNEAGTLDLLIAARDAKVKRVLFAGSSSVYGELEKLPKHEDDPLKPISPYGLTKLVGEEYLRLFKSLYGLETVTLRYYNVFGPRQNPDGPYAAVIPLFIRWLLRGEAPRVHGDGEQSRDFTYVENVVDANLLAMEAPAEKVSAGLFNVAAGGRHSLNDLLRILGEILGVDPQPVHEPARVGDVRHSQADISRIEACLGFRAGVSFEEGLKRTVAYFREQEQG